MRVRNHSLTIDYEPFIFEGAKEYAVHCSCMIAPVTWVKEDDEWSIEFRLARIEHWIDVLSES